MSIGEKMEKTPCVTVSTFVSFQLALDLQRFLLQK